jgi:hypothetical protein
MTNLDGLARRWDKFPLIDAQIQNAAALVI